MGGSPPPHSTTSPTRCPKRHRWRWGHPWNQREAADAKWQIGTTFSSSQRNFTSWLFLFTIWVCQAQILKIPQLLQVEHFIKQNIPPCWLAGVQKAQDSTCRTIFMGSCKFVTSILLPQPSHHGHRLSKLFTSTSCFSTTPKGSKKRRKIFTSSKTRCFFFSPQTKTKKNNKFEKKKKEKTASPGCHPFSGNWCSRVAIARPRRPSAEGVTRRPPARCRSEGYLPPCQRAPQGLQRSHGPMVQRETAAFWQPACFWFSFDSIQPFPKSKKQKDPQDFLGVFFRSFKKNRHKHHRFCEISSLLKSPVTWSPNRRDRQGTEQNSTTSTRCCRNFSEQPCSKHKSNFQVQQLTPFFYVDVSENRGTPKSSILIGFSIINHPLWGTPIIGNTHFSMSHGKNHVIFTETVKETKRSSTLPGKKL